MNREITISRELWDRPLSPEEEIAFGVMASIEISRMDALFLCPSLANPAIKWLERLAKLDGDMGAETAFAFALMGFGRDG